MRQEQVHDHVQASYSSMLRHCSACRSFDKDNIDAAVMKKIQTYTPQPDFQPDKIKKVTVLIYGAVTDVLHPMLHGASLQLLLHAHCWSRTLHAYVQAAGLMSMPVVLTKLPAHWIALCCRCPKPPMASAAGSEQWRCMTV